MSDSMYIPPLGHTDHYNCFNSELKNRVGLEIIESKWLVLL